MKQLFNVQSRIFIPLWRRIALVAVTLGWAAVEFANGATLWALGFAAAGLWCAHQFFIAFDPPPAPEADKTTDGTAPHG